MSFRDKKKKKKEGFMENIRKGKGKKKNHPKQRSVSSVLCGQEGATTPVEAARKGRAGRYFAKVEMI